MYAPILCRVTSNEKKNGIANKYGSHNYRYKRTKWQDALSHPELVYMCSRASVFYCSMQQQLARLSCCSTGCGH